RVFHGDLVAQAQLVRSQRESLDGVFGRARRHAYAEAGHVGREGDGVDDEGVAVPTADGVAVLRRLYVVRMRGGHVDDALEVVARVVELHHDFVLADVDRTQLVEYGAERGRLDVAETVAKLLRLSGLGVGVQRESRHRPERGTGRGAVRRPMSRDARRRRQRSTARVGRVERMNLAVSSRDVEDSHLLAPAAAI